MDVSIAGTRKRLEHRSRGGHHEYGLEAPEEGEFPRRDVLEALVYGDDVEEWPEERAEEEDGEPWSTSGEGTVIPPRAIMLWVKNTAKRTVVRTRANVSVPRCFPIFLTMMKFDAEVRLDRVINAAPSGGT